MQIWLVICRFGDDVIVLARDEDEARRKAAGRHHGTPGTECLLPELASVTPIGHAYASVDPDLILCDSGV